MKSFARDTLQGLPCPITVTARIPIKSRRKQRLITREMFRGEKDCHPFTPPDPHMFEFPKLDFGMPAMGKVELKQALNDQLYLHGTNTANGTGVDHPNPQELTSDAVTGYQNHRLAAVSWFAEIIPFQLISNEDHHSVLIPAVNVMDRYITTCVDLGEDLSRLLKNIGNIRAACLSLSLKMHAVFMDIHLKHVHQRNDWVNKALAIDSSSDTDKPGFNVYILSDIRGIQEAENEIISKLRGAVFPANAENTISILCKYLILEHLSRQTSNLLAPTYILNKRVTMIAAKFLSKTALDVRLLNFNRWKCIAVCCLLGVIDVCVTDPEEGLHLEDSLISLLEELKPGEFTLKELCDLKQLLTQGCVVCSNTFVDRAVHKSLLKISSMSCCECRKKPLVRGTNRRIFKGNLQRVTLCSLMTL